MLKFALCFCLVLLATTGTAWAVNTCTFDTTATVQRLTGDCTTDTPIVVEDGLTLDGGGHTIVALDPVDGFFRGAVVMSGGASASVINTVVSTLLLANVCQTGANQLRGIYFERAAGVIRGNTIIGINKGTSSCQEGNAIEVRNPDFGSEALAVEISQNTIGGYQKTGIVAHGNLDVAIRHNRVGASMAQAYLPANGVQVSSGARAIIEMNTIRGNSWAHHDAAATGILLIGSAPGTVVRSNAVLGNADVGIYVLADAVTVMHNRLEETGPDGFYDVGIGNYGIGNVFAGNSVRGYETPYHGVPQEQERAITVASR